VVIFGVTDLLSVCAVHSSLLLSLTLAMCDAPESLSIFKNKKYLIIILYYYKIDFSRHHLIFFFGGYTWKPSAKILQGLRSYGLPAKIDLRWWPG
jgi:hypothetical protein